ncbi:MAG TPA: hypothetical protein VIK84_01530 [Haloplasmataceae bacterium]
MKDKTRNKLNTPYRTNVEYAKKKTKKDSNSRYDYEFGNEVNNSAKDTPLARGANIANAFSYSTPLDEVTPQRLKSKFQDDLRQNYNVEIADEKNKK